MKFWSILLLSTVLMVATIQAKNRQCKDEGGVCVNKGKLKNCEELAFKCKGDNNRCCKKNPLTGKAVKRVCKGFARCTREGGNCIKTTEEDTCPTVTDKKLCKGKTCTCCIGDNKKCGRSSACTDEGGICIKKSNEEKYCSSGYTDDELCPGDKCVCCILDGTSDPTTGCKCGEANKVRIVGGEEVSPRNKYPWMVGLQTVFFEGRYACGAALINDLYVVTAAHCLYSPKTGEVMKPNQMRVGLGDHKQFSTNDDVDGVTRLVKVESFIPHPDFSISGFENDIALIKLRKPIDLTADEEVKPLCLPEDDSNSYEGYDSIVTGWGLQDYYYYYYDSPPNGLREVTVPILGLDCNGYEPDIITENMLCAGFKKGGKDACSGDSGGPLFVYEDGSYTLVGIVAFGDGCAQRKTPGVYTRVTSYLKWIADNTKDGSYC